MVDISAGAPYWLKVVAAMIPLGLAGLTTIAWQNSHTLSLLAVSINTVRDDLERTRAGLEPGATLRMRLDRNETELAHLRELIEQRLTCK